MSGGSWDYVSFKVQEAAERLVQSDIPERRALGARLAPIAEALHRIEWVDSCDSAKGSEIPAILEALTPFGDPFAQVEAEAVAMLRDAIHRLESVRALREAPRG